MVENQIYNLHKYWRAKKFINMHNIKFMYIPEPSQKATTIH